MADYKNLIYKILSAVFVVALTALGIQPSHALESHDEETSPTVVTSEVESKYETKIIGGQPAQIIDAPWQVALISVQYLPTRDTYGNNLHVDYFGQFCGGSIYNSMWIVTAAHCVDNNPNLSKLRVLAGSAVLSQTSLSKTLVDRIVVHPGWNPDTNENDIALIRLKAPLVFSSQVQPIFLPREAPVPGTQALITGWGNQSTEDDDFPADLQQALVSIDTDNYCDSMYSTYNSALMMCASNEDYTIDTCQGDSGGPLAVNNSGRWELHGITSFGSGCAEQDYPGVYAETFHYVSWIEATTDLSQFRLSPTPTITGSLTIDSTLTTTPGTWSDNATLSYQWLESNQVIEGEISPTLTLTAGLVGKRISVRVTGTQQGFVTTTRTSSQTAAVSGYTQDNPGAQTITGTLHQGQTIQAPDANNWGAGTTLSYVWYRGTRVIPGATSQSYTLTAADINQNIKVSVTGTRSGFNPRTITSPLTGKVLGVFSSTPTPTISGSFAVGSTLTARAGSWSPKPTLSYQWLRNGSPISRATSSSYKLTAADRDQLISVRVTAKRSSYLPQEVTSADSDLITIQYRRSVNPTISVTGPLQVGSTMTANPGSWDPGDSEFTFQWLASNVPIEGATASTLSLSNDLHGKRISVRVTGSNAGFLTTTRVSAQTGAVAGLVQDSPGFQVITGTLEQGEILEAVMAGWHQDATLSYVWYRGTRVIPGARSLTYTLTAADINQSIRVSVTGNRLGYNPRTITSGATGRVLGVFSNPPTPTISGTFRVGSILTARPGSWSPAPSFRYQWLRNGTPIGSPGTASTYKLTAADLNSTISVRVEASRTNYQPSGQTSGESALVELGTISTKTPTISGSLVRSGKLTATPGVWSPSPTFSYQWLRNGSPISGATSRDYFLTSADFGQQLIVRVSASVEGYVQVTLESDPRDNWTTVRSTWGTYLGVDLYDDCIWWGEDSNAEDDWQNIGDTFWPCEYDDWGDAELYNDGEGMLVYAGMTGLPSDTVRYRLTFTYWTQYANQFYFYATNLALGEFSDSFEFRRAGRYGTITSNWIDIKNPGEVDYVIQGRSGVQGFLQIERVKLEIERYK
jgi:secreted trypsin-like serine protease